MTPHCFGDKRVRRAIGGPKLNVQNPVAKAQWHSNRMHKRAVKILAQKTTKRRRLRWVIAPNSGQVDTRHFRVAGKQQVMRFALTEHAQGQFLRRRLGDFFKFARPQWLRRVPARRRQVSGCRSVARFIIPAAEAWHGKKSPSFFLTEQHEIRYTVSDDKFHSERKSYAAQAHARASVSAQPCRKVLPPHEAAPSRHALTRPGLRRLPKRLSLERVFCLCQCYRERIWKRNGTYTRHEP